MRKSGCWGMLAVALVLLATGGCGSSNGSTGVMSEDEVVSFCEALIEQVEGESDATQLEGFEQTRQYVAGYAYAGRSPRQDPETIEPADQAALYRMIGAVALLNGNGSASVWCSAQSALLAPADPDSLSQLGVVLIEKDRCEDAERLLLTAKSHDADQNELMRLSLAAAEACQNKNIEAQQEVAEALELAPDSVMARTAMMDYRGEQVDAIVGLEESLYAVCENDINQALQLASTQAVADFTAAKQQEAQELTQQMLNMYTSMPADVPFELITNISDLQSQYDMQNGAITDQMSLELDVLFDAWSESQDDLAQQLSDCCEAAGGYPCCGCFKHHCQGNWGYLNIEDFPASQDVLAHYLRDALTTLVRAELGLTGTLMAAFPKMSDPAVLWTAQLVYNPLTVYCKSISLGVANVQMHIHATRDVAEAECEAAEIECQTEEYLAEWLAQQQELQRLAEEAAAEALRLAKAKTSGKDDGLTGEVCLDSIGCLGIDGGKFSVKIGGPLYAQFSIDTDNLSVGVRVGAGISDPTGGNIAGADISIGGEVGASGTSFDVTHSQSAALGTVKRDYHLFKSSFRFR